ncbi:bifunctional biotin--[acetyl-CoA-carboxylase] ligase/biotin operon repressor BirA [Teredinibacter haidensis]|uniref:bifunctional biotin--[acetyl-CoA-carboxylase] ligase/biotin operon repressor BirA n=1 Tax=Teredinibacter haidensis TaxID=2731755 RepID=UPI000948C008|nr:bifunctional biotin--[acetyl-CoA-carboxylase] ligase/biotin operon repressor BirA [Teredinibacter haidensis]
MNSNQLLLIQCLADGEFHSGEKLGELAGISRAAVWKQLQSLQPLGIEVISHKGRGYALGAALSLLGGDKILGRLSEASLPLVSALDVIQQVESTNQTVLQHIGRGGGHGYICLAEQQTAGRGRRGRVWQSPYAANVYLSIGWRFSQGVAALEGLSLAVGVAVAEALCALGYDQPRLKWPNDVLVEGRKLGGILLEMSGDASGDCYIVVGVGLNVRMPEALGASIDQAWVDLASLPAKDGLKAGLDRNAVVAALLNELIPLLSNYEQSGFSRYKKRWEKLNAYRDREVSLVMPNSTLDGRMLGVTESGGLRLLVGAEERVFLGGEISVRERPVGRG